MQAGAQALPQRHESRGTGTPPLDQPRSPADTRAIRSEQHEFSRDLVDRVRLGRADRAARVGGLLEFRVPHILPLRMFRSLRMTITCLIPVPSIHSSTIYLYCRKTTLAPICQGQSGTPDPRVRHRGIIGEHHEDSEDTKDEETMSCLLILYNLKRTPKGPSGRSFVDFVSFVVSLGEDLGSSSKSILAAHQGR